MIEVQLPNGQTVTVQTDDPQVAAAAGRKFMAASAPQAERISLGAPGVGAGVRVGRGPPANAPRVPRMNTAQDVGLSTLNGLNKAGAEVVKMLGGMMAPAQSNPLPSPTKRLDPIGQLAANPLAAVATIARLAGQDKVADMLSTSAQGGDIYKPQTTPGKYASTTAQMATNALLTKGGFAPKVASVVLPGVLSEAAGQATKGTKAEPFARVGGAVLGGVGAGVRVKDVRSLTDALKPAAKAPTLEELQQARTAAYQAVDNAGVRYTPEAFQRLADGITSEMQASSISALRHPKAYSMLEDIQGLAAGGDPPTLTQLDQVRQVVRRDVASSIDPAEKFFGEKMIKNIDEFIDATTPHDLVEGSAESAGLIKNARELHSRVKKIETVNKEMDAAAERAAASGSGGNINNATRQATIRVKKKIPNLKPDEQKAADRVIYGTPAQNLFRQVGKLSPEGNGLGLTLNVAAAAGSGGATLPLTLAGAASKRIADGMTQRRVAELVQIMARGGTAGKTAEQQLAIAAAKDRRVAMMIEVAKRGAIAGVVASPAQAGPGQ